MAASKVDNCAQRSQLLVLSLSYQCHLWKSPSRRRVLSAFGCLLELEESESKSFDYNFIDVYDTYHWSEDFIVKAGRLWTRCDYEWFGKFHKELNSSMTYAYVMLYSKSSSRGSFPFRYREVETSKLKMQPTAILLLILELAKTPEKNHLS
ncbi:hypothetical protein ABKN59_005220 [Abortiporus biennis]